MTCCSRWTAGGVAAMLLAAGGLAVYALTDKAKPPAELRERFGNQTIAILQGAERVEVFRVDPKDYSDPEQNANQDGRFGGYKITGTAKEHGQEFARKVVQLLLDGGNYELVKAKGCKFDPGVAMRFWKANKESADILFCYKCRELKVVGPNPKLQGVKIPFADFEPGEEKFIKLAKEALPDDQEIQGLKE